MNSQVEERQMFKQVSLLLYSYDYHAAQTDAVDSIANTCMPCCKQQLLCDKSLCIMLLRIYIYCNRHSHYRTVTSTRWHCLQQANRMVIGSSRSSRVRLPTGKMGS